MNEPGTARARTPRLVALLAWLASITAGCNDGGQAIDLRGPDAVLADAATIELSVWSSGARCDANAAAVDADAQVEGAPARFAPGGAVHVALAAGHAVIGARSYDAGGTQIGAGCTEAEVAHGGAAIVVTLAPVAPAMPDGGAPDLAPIDMAAPDLAQPDLAAPTDAGAPDLPLVDDLGDGGRTPDAMADAGVQADLVVCPAPANDTCPGAIPLVASQTLTATMTCAKDDTSATCGGAGGPDEYYSFSINSASNVRVTVVPSGATFDPIISVRTACGDATTEVKTGCFNAAHGEGTTEIADIPDLPAGSYFVVVDSDGPASGAYTVRVDVAGAQNPPNGDTCASAVTLSAGNHQSGDTTNANDDYSPACQPASAKDLVYSINVGNGSPSPFLYLTGASFDARLYLRTQNNCATGPELGCASTPYLYVPNLPGGTYDVFVDGADGAAGAFTINYVSMPKDTTFGYVLAPSMASTFSALPPANGTGVVDVAATYKLQGGNASESEFADVKLPFSFDLFGTAETTVRITHEGYLDFDASAPSSSPVCIASAQPPNGIVAPFWEDLVYLPGTSSLKYATLGFAPARTFVVEWGRYAFRDPNNAGKWSGSMSFQALLHEDGDVEFQYGPGQSAGTGCGPRIDGCSAVVGIEAPDGLTGKSVSCRSNSVVAANGNAIYIVHPQ